MKVPCKGCDRRVVGCHPTCSDYKQFQEENEKVNKAKRQYNVNSYCASDIAKTKHVANVLEGRRKWRR